jgi:hypothetical protein
MKPTRSLLCIFIAALLSACNGGDSSEAVYEANGTWDVQVNLVSDDCGLVDPSESGFSDEHQVITGAAGYELSAVSGLPASSTGTIENDIVYFESEEQLDLLGDGSLCSQVVTVNYSDITDVDATVTFGFSVDCGEIFACSSLGLGRGVRR